MGEKATRVSRSGTDATTIKDVARAAGVSVATVSRVLNGSAPVLEPTRRRILDAARDLRFTPNASARSLSMRRTTALGVVLPDLHGEFFSELLRGIDRAAQAHGRHVLVSSSHHDARGMSEALRAMHGRVDGLIVMAPDVPAEGLADALPHTIPTVLVNCAAIGSRRDLRVDELAVDNFGGAVAMTAHLASLGHKRIGFIAGAALNEDSAERERGYVATMQRLGLAAPTEYRRRGDFTEEGGHAATGQLLDLATPPTAIFAANDMMALGAILCARDRGLNVPADLAIAGFDDIPTARYVTPPLTTVRVDVEALGERAATLLERRMTGESRARISAHSELATRQVVPSTLIIRDSCGSNAAGVSTGSTSPDRRAGRGDRSTSPRTPPGKSNPIAANQEPVS